MKKQQKIIEIRTSANVKLEDLKAKMKTGIARAAQTHAEILSGMTDKCDNERFNEIERFKAEKSAIEAGFYQEKAALYAETETACAAAEDDQEPEKEQPQPQQETVYCDGSEHSARIVARRLLNKMPHIPAGGFLHVHIVEDGSADNREYFVSVWYGNDLRNVNTIFAPGLHTAEFEADFLEKARRMFDDKAESGNSHVAEPLSRALDAVFGGNPVEHVDNLIADTVKSGKEGGNE